MNQDINVQCGGDAVSKCIMAIIVIVVAVAVVIIITIITYQISNHNSNQED